MKKHILMITTGGTISSIENGHGLEPGLDPSLILKETPSVLDLCSVDCFPLFELDSTNIGPEHWVSISALIEEKYDYYDGFVILHGTDTMAYTSAALSYLIQNNKKPVVLTGSQRPLKNEITDAKRNIYDSFLYASDTDSSGVSIVFDGHVIIGTRARKTHSKSFNAFSSIDFPDLGVIRNNKIVRFIKDPLPVGKPVFSHGLSRRVFILQITPGMDPGIFSFLKAYYDVLIIESFGVGGIPCYNDNKFISALEDWLESGHLLVMTTQVPHEGSDMSIYRVGMTIKEKYEILEGYDMTHESVYTKMMWIWNTVHNFDMVKELFYRPISHDIIEF